MICLDLHRFRYSSWMSFAKGSKILSCGVDVGNLVMDARLHPVRLAASLGEMSRSSRHRLQNLARLALSGFSIPGMVADSQHWAISGFMPTPLILCSLEE